MAKKKKEFQNPVELPKPIVQVLRTNGEKHENPIDKLAGPSRMNKHYERNKELTVLREKYPYHPRRQYVELYYPHAVGGPLYVDMVEHPELIKECELKKSVLRELGLRYLIVTPKMKYEDLLEGLGEL